MAVQTQSHSAKPPGNFNNSVSKAAFDFIVIKLFTPLKCSHKIKIQYKKKEEEKRNAYTKISSKKNSKPKVDLSRYTVVDKQNLEKYLFADS